MKTPLAFTLMLSLVVAGCGGAGDTTESQSPAPGEGASTTAAATVDLENVTTASALWQIRGHHIVAIELSSGGDKDGSIVHTRHPIDELMALISTEVAENAGAEGPALVESLDAQIQAAADAAIEDDTAAIEAAATDTETTIQQAIAALPAGDTEAFTGSAIADLLTTAGHEYEEAVVDGELALLVEFQDAYAFVTVAHVLYEEIAPTVIASAPEDAAKIDEAFETLMTALPGATPPEELADPEDVEAAAALIGHELEETVGAVVSHSVDASETWEHIDQLLDEIQAAYDAGDADAAAELAAEAYLENYELVEASVIEADPEVNAELEPLLGADLRAQIAANVSSEELAAMIARARALIEMAKEATADMDTGETGEMEAAH